MSHIIDYVKMPPSSDTGESQPSVERLSVSDVAQVHVLQVRDESLRSRRGRYYSILGDLYITREHRIPISYAYIPYLTMSSLLGRNVYIYSNTIYVCNIYIIFINSLYYYSIYK